MPRLDPTAIRTDADALVIGEIDLLADTWADRVPHAEFDRLRRDAPVHWHPETDDTGFWVVTRHEDVVAVSRDADVWSTELGGTFIPTQADDHLAAMRLSILNMDEPHHSRMRKLVSAGFMPRQIRYLQQAISEHATTIVDDVLEQDGQVDVVDTIASRLPLEMICEMLGVPSSDWSLMRGWSDRLVGWDDPELSPSADDQVLAATEVFMYCNELVAHRKDNPGPDILSTLVHAVVDGDRLTEIELNLFFVTLMIAGNETTRNLIAHGMLALIEHPDQLAALRADPSLLPTATDEMLRWGSSIQNFRRTATRDTQLRGQKIAQGDKLVTFYLAANYDESVFANPYAFMVDRAPNPHVTFGGGGPHFCLGAHLARAEISAITWEVVSRLDDLELAGEPARLRSDFINGLKRLPMRFTPARSLALR